MQRCITACAISWRARCSRYSTDGWRRSTARNGGKTEQARSDVKINNAAGQGECDETPLTAGQGSDAMRCGTMWSIVVVVATANADLDKPRVTELGREAIVGTETRGTTSASDSFRARNSLGS